MSNGITIDFDTADRITLLVLKDQLKYLRKELEDYKEGKWLHSEDVVRNAEIIAALELLIPYYGGTVV
jgi:tRNA G37 N-methylase Trm5